MTNSRIDAATSTASPNARFIVEPKPDAEAKKSDSTGSIDLNDIGELDLADDADSSGSSLAALEEISKQHKGKS